MDKNKINYSKIIVVIVISFFIAQYSGREFFLPNSAQIRPNLSNYLAKKFNIFFNKTSLTLSRFKEVFNPNNAEARLKKMPLQLVSKGVYAKSNDTISYTLIRVDEVEWQEYTFMVNGKEIKLRVPKGMNPPSQKEMDLVYGK